LIAHFLLLRFSTLESLAHYAFNLAQDLCIQPPAAGIDAARILAGNTAVSGVFCFFVTFFLVGLWMGAPPSFIVFGVLQEAESPSTVLAGLVGRPARRKGYKAFGRNPIYIAFGRA